MIDRNIPFSEACYKCPTEYSQLFTGRLVAFSSYGTKYSKKVRLRKLTFSERTSEMVMFESSPWTEFIR
jgi:hypothetical protein